jgi:hypothetical protein
MFDRECGTIISRESILLHPTRADERSRTERMELKIQAWAFTSEVDIGKDISSLAKWQPNRNAPNSEFIASLRDDILALKRLAWGASIAVGSIASGPPPMPDMPVAMPYPVN